MLDHARKRATATAADNVEFVVADAHTDDLGDSVFDVAISRFGVMFFDDPTAAFTHIARSLRPGGRLSFVCWQDLGAND